MRTITKGTKRPPSGIGPSPAPTADELRKALHVLLGLDAAMLARLHDWQVVEKAEQVRYAVADR